MPNYIIESLSISRAECCDCSGKDEDDDDGGGLTLLSRSVEILDLWSECLGEMPRCLSISLAICWLRFLAIGPVDALRRSTELQVPPALLALLPWQLEAVGIVPGEGRL